MNGETSENVFKDLVSSLAGANKTVVPALGLSEPPTEFLCQLTTYALSSHLMYGFNA